MNFFVLAVTLLVLMFVTTLVGIVIIIRQSKIIKKAWDANKEVHMAVLKNREMTMDLLDRIATGQKKLSFRNEMREFEADQILREIEEYANS